MESFEVSVKESFIIRDVLGELLEVHEPCF